jgi:putative toxin-antitoxin system antitoxin component (TIGR02293 family)
MPDQKDKELKIGFVRSWSGNDSDQPRRVKSIVEENLVPQLVELQNELGLSVKEMARIMNMSESTLLRRYKNINAPLNDHESDILMHLLQVIREGLEVYEDMSVLKQWLHTPLPVLSHQIPKNLLWSIRGRIQLLDVLNQLKHGYTF